MDYEKLYQLLTLSETLVGHPHLASVKRLVDHEIRELEADAIKAGAELDAKLKSEQQKAAVAQAEREAEANAKARRHQEGTPMPVRNTYEGVPGPAEAADEALAKPKAIPSDRTPWVEPKDPTQPDLPVVDRRL